MNLKLENIYVLILTLNLFGVLAECDISLLCTEIKVCLIISSVVAIIAIGGIIVLGIKLSRGPHQKRLSTGRKIDQHAGGAVYDEIDDKALTKGHRIKRQEVRPPQYEDVVIKETAEKYDSLIHRRRSIKRTSRKVSIRKSNRFKKLESSEIEALGNLYILTDSVCKTIESTKHDQMEEKTNYMTMNTPQIKQDTEQLDKNLQDHIPYVSMTSPELIKSEDTSDKKTEHSDAKIE